MLREQKAELEHKEYMLKEREIKCKEEEGAFLRFKEEHSKLKRNYEDLSRKLNDTEEILKGKNIELSTITNVARKAQETLNNIEAENKILREKFNMIEKAYKEEKVLSGERKDEYNKNTANLKEELKQCKNDLSNLKSYYENAEKERAEVTSYKLNQAKTNYEDIIAKKDKRLRNLKHDLEDERAFNDMAPDKYRTRDFQRGYEDELSSSGSVLNDSEYLAQKDRWAQLERETDALKSNIRIALAPSDSLGINIDPNKVPEDLLRYDREVIKRYDLPQVKDIKKTKVIPEDKKESEIIPEQKLKDDLGMMENDESEIDI